MADRSQNENRADRASIPGEGRPVRIATFAVPLSGNKGSASMLLGIKDAFEDAGVAAEFSVFSYYPDRDKALSNGCAVYGGHPLHIVLRLLPAILLSKPFPTWGRRFRKLGVEALREADVVLLIGGTTFADSMLYKVPWNVLAALPGYLLRRPTMFLSQTLGPIKRRGNRLLAKATLKRAVVVHGRGKTSAAWAKHIGIPHTAYWPDLSFSMKIPKTFQSLASRYPAVDHLRQRLQSHDGYLVGISPNTIVESKARKNSIDYVGFLTQVVDAIESLGHLPVLIPHSYRRESGATHNNDRELCLRVTATVSAESRLLFVDEDLDPRELRLLIGRCDLLVASRFHAMISALATNVPPLTYGWGGHKYLEVLEEFDLADLYTPFAKLSDVSIHEQIHSVLKRRKQLVERIDSTRSVIQEFSAQLPHEIMSALAGEQKRSAVEHSLRSSI